MKCYIITIAACFLISVSGGYDRNNCTEQKSNIQSNTLTNDDRCNWWVENGAPPLDFADCTNLPGDPTCPEAENCAPGACRTHCDCGGCQECYIPCQLKNFDIFQPKTDGLAEEDAYCYELQQAYFENSHINLGNCDGNCGICSEKWCAQLDVFEDSIPPTEQACELGKFEDYDSFPRTCTKQIRRDCQPSDLQLLAREPVIDHCFTSCGYPIYPCDGVPRSFVPMDGFTDFAQLCQPGGSSSNFRVTPGACTDRPKYVCENSQYYGGAEQYGNAPDLPTHILQWDVLRTANSLCDPACSGSEQHFQWGACAETRLGETWDEMCFVVTNQHSGDIGTCELSTANAKAFTCAGEEIGKCPNGCGGGSNCKSPNSATDKGTDNTDSDSSSNNMNNNQESVQADPAAANQASTYLITSVVGIIAVVHTML